MIKKELNIVSSRANIKKIKALLDGSQDKSWVYFGDDFLTFASLERQLKNHSTYVDIIGVHKEVADTIKAEYVKWVDELNNKYGNEISWWFGSVFSRNNYSSDLFQRACYLEILNRSFSEKGILPDMIFVGSSGFAKDIRDWAIKRNIRVSIGNELLSITKLAVIFKPIFDWLRFNVVLILRCLAAFLSKFRSKVRRPLSKNSVIIHTFIHDNSLSKDGTLTDRYLPFLYDFASRKNLNLSVIPMLYGFKYSYLSIYIRMRNSSIPFIIKEDFLHLSDYFIALTYPIRSLKMNLEVNDFRSFRLVNSIKEMRRRECFTTAMNAVLIYRLFFRLKETEFSPKLFVLWFENQIIDRALIAGVRRFFSKVKIIGAQMFLHPPNLLSLFPAQSEVEAKISPDVLIETSAYQCNRAQIFTNSICCKVGAALRYSHVFENCRNPSTKEFIDKTVLVVLPFFLPSSIEILTLVKDAFLHIKHSVSVLIKVHPDCSEEMIKSKFAKTGLPEDFRFISCSLAAALKNASIVISANSSSMVEAVSYGIPVIYAGSRIMINQNILKDLHSEIIRECYTPLELADTINGYFEVFPEKLNEYKQIGKKIRDQYFTPVSDGTLAPFFNLENSI